MAANLLPKLALVICHMVRTGEAYDDGVFAQMEVNHRIRTENRLKAQAQALGFTLVPRSSHA
jgi:hypothetical protein